MQMKAEVDHAGGEAYSDDCQATPPRAPSRVGGSVLGDPPSDGGKVNVRALLGRVRAIQNDHQPRPSSYHPTTTTTTHHGIADYEDRMAHSDDYERPRWRDTANDLHVQPSPVSGSYHEQKYNHNHHDYHPQHHHDQYPTRHDHHHRYQLPDQHRQYSYGRDNNDDDRHRAPDHRRHDPPPRHERSYPRGGYEDDDRRRRDYIDTDTSSRPSSADYHRHQLPSARDDVYRSRPPPPRGYDHSPQAPPDFLAYAYVPPVSRRVGAWREEAEDDDEQYVHHAAAPVPVVDANYPRSYAPPLIENLPRRRMANPPPSPPASYHRPHQSGYDSRRHDPYDQEIRDEHVIIRDEPRSPPRLKARRSAANHESSSYQSTSNSPALSFISSDDEEDEGNEVAYRDEHDDDNVDYDGEKYNDDNEEMSDEPQTQTVRLSDLTPEMYEDHELHSEFRHALHMIIPANAFGCLIGNRGAIIRKINAQTQCTLSIRDPDVFSVKDDRVLRIYGKAKGICLAQHLVIEKIRAHRIKKQDPNYTPLLDNGADLHDLMLPPLPESSITKCMNDSLVVSPAPNNSRQKKSNNASGFANGSLKWLVPSESVGKVMGTGGEILAGIGRSTSTKIHITPSHEMPRGSKERKVTIFGSLENIEAARRIIEKKAGGRAESPGYNSHCGQYFAIPYSTAGSLIGIKGNRVRKITEKTGARLQIPSAEDLPLGSLNRTLHIQGNKKQVEAAYAVACNIVRKELEQLAAENRLEAVLADVDLTIKIILPVRISSFLLEQHGRLIREISEKSGAHAHFSPPCEEETRICVVKGEMSAVFRAERLILQFVAGDTIATKRNGIDSQGIAPREKRKRRVDDPDDEESEDEYKEPSTPRSGRSVRQGDAKRGRPNERAQMSSNANGRRAQLNDNPGNRRVEMVARLNGRPNERGMAVNSNPRPPLNQRTQPGRQNENARGTADKEPDIIDRLQAPLQSARGGGNANKRQRR